MEVLKHTSPTAEPTAPSPRPLITVPSASTRRAVRGVSAQGAGACCLVPRPFWSVEGVMGCSGSCGVPSRRSDGRAATLHRNMNLRPATYLRSPAASINGSARLATSTDRAYMTRQSEGDDMRDQLSQSIKDAMKSGDKRRLATLRLI